MLSTLSVVGVPLAAAHSEGPTRQIVSMTSSAWAPYIGPALPGDGYIYQLVRQAFALSGYELQVTYYPWARAVHTARAGSSYAGVFPEYYSSGREDDFVYSDPFPCGPISLFKKRGAEPEFLTNPLENQEKALSELRQYRFGVVRGYINTDVLDNAAFLRREESRSDELNLRKLHFGRVDLVAIDPYVAEYLLKTTLAKYSDELVRMRPDLEHKQVYIAFSRRARNYRELIKAFNSGLEIMRSSGELQRMLVNYGFDELAAGQTDNQAYGQPANQAESPVGNLPE